MREFEALKQAVQMGVKAGIYSMEDVVMLHHSLGVVGNVVNAHLEAEKAKKEKEDTEEKNEPEMAKVDE